ncbi:hypothetical protein FBY35_3974 [Streptomyces sp. SLBN-118]|uniref:hypothetical protein n=1 Tax=Streptomyces sp. SLBN-118 TaxID=2768454 RepID=UPI001173B71B|nr:hypothetical protein [Streptomyces sp. SLBN-118]TQK42552.1 hypothetical protein FBY35_3974 [Streptomyces sp. SLBN-118]
MRLARVTLAGMMVASGMLAFGASPAQAATYCTAWKQVENFQQRACVITESGTKIKHRHYVRNLIDRTQKTQVTTFRYINGSVSICKGARVETFSALQTKSWSCESRRVSGSKYMTRGYITKQAGGNVRVDSRTITG